MNDQNPFTKISNSPIFVYLLIICTIVTIIQLFYTAIILEDYFIVVDYGIVAFFILGYGWYIHRKNKERVPPLIRKLFRPFEKLNRENAWPRISEEKELIETIYGAENKPVILVGESGVGKSVIISSHIIPTLEDEDWVTITFSNYADIETQILNKLRIYINNIELDNNGKVSGVNDKNKKVLLVYDQFEQFISQHSKNTTIHEKSRSWFFEFVSSALGIKDLRILIVVRKEWYYDLRFLKIFVPSPNECVHLSGLKMDRSKSSIDTLRMNLTKVTKNENISNYYIKNLTNNGEISPIEAQIIGCMLENKSEAMEDINGEEDFRKKLISKDNLIDDFFNYSLKSSPNKSITLSVLFALSIEVKYRNQLTFLNLVNVIHKPQSEVKNSLKFLMEQNLINMGDNQHYQLAHDYLAEKFHDISGSELHPRERDNILFFSDELRKNTERKSMIKKIDSNRKWFTLLSDYAFAFLIFIITFRVFTQLTGFKMDWFNPIKNFDPDSPFFDIYYFPVFITHFAWSYYVTIFYRRFFSFLKEGRIGRFLSILSVFTCVFSVVLAVFIPNYWIFSIGFGGFWIGVKIYQLSLVNNLSKISMEEFRNAGIETIANSIFVIVTGIIFANYFNNIVDIINAQNTYLTISIFATIILTYAMFVVRKLHVSNKAASIWLGIYDRRQNRTSMLT